MLRQWGCNVLRLALSLCALNAGYAIAGDWSFVSPEENQWVVLTGTIEGRSVDVSRTIQVRVAGKPGQSAVVTAKAVSINAYEEKEVAAENASAPGPLPIEPITVSAETKSAPAQAWVDLSISARGITRCTYVGNLDLVIATEPDTTRRIRVKVVVGVKPNIEIVEKSVSLNVSNCSWGCGFTEWISPGTTTRNKAILTIVNQAPIKVIAKAEGRLDGTTLLAYVLFPPKKEVSDTSKKDAAGDASKKDAAETSKEVSGKDEVESVEIEPKARGYLEVPIDRSSLLPGHYTGAAILTVTAAGLPNRAAIDDRGTVNVDNATVATVPMTLDVRAGALVPFLIILLGVMAGRLSKFLSNKNRELRVALFSVRLHLRDRLQALTDSVAQRHCQSRLDVIWARVLADDPSETQLRQDLANLSSEIDLFGRVQQLRDETRATQLSAADQAAVDTALDAATQALIRDALPDATTALNKAEVALEAGIANRARAAPVSSAQQARLRGLAASAKADVAVRTEAQALRNSKWRNAVRYVLAAVSGIDTTESIALQYWLLRPLFFVFLILAVSVYGLWLQYAGVEHSTFGSKGFTEYMGLFLWGFGAQVVAMNFQDVQFTRKG